MTDQLGTGGLTVGGSEAAFETMLTLPIGALIDTVTINDGGSPDTEDIVDSDGAFHTRLVFERLMDTIQAVFAGKDYAVGGAGEMDGTTYLDSVAKAYGKSAIRVTIGGTTLPTAS